MNNWKAVLFDFNGVIIRDELIHQELISEIILGENLRPSHIEFCQVCIGRSDRACLKDLLALRGRVVSDEYLTKLILAKARSYQQKIESMPELPIYSGLKDFLLKIQAKGLYMGIVTGALRSEVDLILERAGLTSYFNIIVSGDEISVSKPEPDGYLLAVERFNQEFPHLELKADNCLVIEDSLAGIEAAKRAKMTVVGVANTYPFHMLQRCTNWTVDYLVDLELDRVEEVFAKKLLK